MNSYTKLRHVISLILALLFLANLEAHSDEVPKIKANWNLKDKTVNLEFTNLGPKSIQISPMADYQSRDIADTNTLDLENIGYIPHGNAIVNICIIFFMKSKHPDLASFSLGGKIPAPITVSAGGHGLIKFPLNENFVKVAGFSDKISFLLIYNSQIIDTMKIIRKAGDSKW